MSKKHRCNVLAISFFLVIAFGAILYGIVKFAEDFRGISLNLVPESVIRKHYPVVNLQVKWYQAREYCEKSGDVLASSAGYVKLEDRKLMLSPNMTSNYCYWLGFERHLDNQFVRVPDDGRQAVQNFEGWAERYSPQDHPGWKHFSVFYRPNNTHHAQLYMMPPYSQCHFVCEPK